MKTPKRNKDMENDKVVGGGVIEWGRWIHDFPPFSSSSSCFSTKSFSFSRPVPRDEGVSVATGPISP